jgi:hypothetical protein
MNRRTVLRQSVKLSYATPLIAASMRMEMKGAAASPGPEGPCIGYLYVCADDCCDQPCGPTGLCHEG